MKGPVFFYRVLRGIVNSNLETHRDLKVKN